MTKFWENGNLYEKNLIKMAASSTIKFLIFFKIICSIIILLFMDWMQYGKLGTYESLTHGGQCIRSHVFRTAEIKIT